MSNSGKTPNDPFTAAPLLLHEDGQLGSQPDVSPLAFPQAARSEAARRWLQENSVAIAAYNARIDAEGTWSEYIQGWWNDYDLLPRSKSTEDKRIADQQGKGTPHG